MSKTLGLLLLMIFVLGIDMMSKAYVHEHIPMMSWVSSVYPYGGVPVFQDWHGIDFSMVHVINRGAAWGIFASVQEYLLYARVAIIGGLLTYLFFIRASAYRKFCLMLVATGALGNVVDYFVYGHVVDMFYFIFWGHSYPVFNIADSVIFLGMMLLVGEALFAKIQSKGSSKSESRRSA